MRIHLFLTVALIVGFTIDGSLSDWSFRDDNGPKYWSKTNGDCSATVQNQSPIDIPKSSGRTYDKSLQTMEFTNYNKEIKGEARNDGSNIKFQKIFTSTDKKIYISKGGLDYNTKYIATEFHFHWSPDNDDEKKIESGHRLEGTQFPMELHIVHYRDDYESLDKAKDYHDGVVIVAFFIKQSDTTNEEYHALTNYLEELKFKAKDDKTKTDIEGFSLKNITNKDIKITDDEGKHLHHFYYEGTSTSPPCYHVKWIVFKDPIELDKFQIDLFRNTKRVKDGNKVDGDYDAYDKMAPNFRPLQELAGRKVYESFDTSSNLTVGSGAMTTYILDTAVGLPAASVPMILSRQNGTGAFDELERGTTNSDGRGSFLGNSSWQPGVYKLYFDTDTYFKSKQRTGFYPYVEVVFRIVHANQHYHVPLFLSPYGYSTYRGS